MKQIFIPKRFSTENNNLIDYCNEIIDDYMASGYKLTSRQLYYQLVARDVIENTVKSYNRTKTLITDARMAGRMDWDAIEDRGRVLVTPPHWATPEHVLRSAERGFRVDHWDFQPVHCMAMCEKQALEGVLQPAAERLNLPYVSCKGYSSVSLLYNLGQWFKNNVFLDRRSVYILYFGDHDPSGLDMDRDLFERLSMFSEEDGEIVVERVALTMTQVLDFRPPPNPAKLTDTRADGYIKKYGRSSWELDALEPKELANLLNSRVDYVLEEFGSKDIWNKSHEMQSEMKEELQGFASSSDFYKWMKKTDQLYDLRYRCL